jgi:Ca2+/H+ antiporter
MGKDIVAGQIGMGAGFLFEVKFLEILEKVVLKMWMREARVEAKSLLVSVCFSVWFLLLGSCFCCGGGESLIVFYVSLINEILLFFRFVQEKCLNE